MKPLYYVRIGELYLSEFKYKDDELLEINLTSDIKSALFNVEETEDLRCFYELAKDKIGDIALIKESYYKTTERVKWDE